MTGASQGIGAGIVKGFVERGFNVVANSLKMTQSTEAAASNQVVLIDAAEPFGTYVEEAQAGNLFFLSVMLPTEGRLAKFVGRVGAASIELTASDLTEIEQAMPFGVAAGQRTRRRS